MLLMFFASLVLIGEGQFTFQDKRDLLSFVLAQSRQVAKKDREMTLYNLLTTLSIPSLMRLTLKLASRPSFIPVSLRYVNNCFL